MPRNVVGNGINTKLLGVQNYFLGNYLLQMDRNFAKQVNDITIQLWLACDLIFQQMNMLRISLICLAAKITFL